MEHKQHIDIVFTELLNRYKSFFIHHIRSKFEGEEVNDVYQEFCMHLYKILSEKYSTDEDLFNTRSWLKAVLSNFCISILRKKYQKRRVQYVSEDKSSIIRANFSDESFNADRPVGEPNYFRAMHEILGSISKREALILKMKYYYGHPSSRIARLLNVAHVDVTIGRIKQRLIKLNKLKDFEGLMLNMEWFK